MADPTDLTRFPIGQTGDFNVADRNARDFDLLVNGGDRVVTNRAGVDLNSYLRELSQLRETLGALNNTGDWVTATAYQSNDLWRHTGTGVVYIVLRDYTSGASEADDIALSPIAVQVYQSTSGSIPVGPTRPSSVVANNIWFQTVSATEVRMQFYDGTDDILTATYNPTANTVAFSGLGTAAALDTGTGAGDLPTNGDLGSAAQLDVGTGANQVVQLDASSRLPAVDASQLTNVGGGIIRGHAFVEKTDTFSTTSQTFVDVTNLSINYTPTASDSVLYISFMVHCDTSQTNVPAAMRIVDGSTVISQGDAAGSRTRALSQGAHASSGEVQLSNLGGVISYTPGDTNQHTITVQIAKNSSASATAYVNRTGTDSDDIPYPRTPSTMMILEVAP